MNVHSSADHTHTHTHSHSHSHSHSLSLTLTLTCRHAAIIGKGGSVINGMKKEFNCEVQTPPRDTPGSQVTIQGPLKGVVACRKRIEDLVADKVTVVSDTTGSAGASAAAAATAADSLKRLSLSGDIAESLFFSNGNKEGM